ncbi:NAD(P)/FAD-dependent oxidoreductase [Vannielia litorea]|uniref:Sarcosine oxidase n=1 Tax=Vannielia litorea TaxID=1217970 RepID=A0A1N6GXB3_9RHOB|nr:FAD-dependent oxidoreductase [Vannielia litorea]SIO12221.1 sarcosine oxidase [Vannielia litorea]
MARRKRIAIAGRGLIGAAAARHAALAGHEVTLIGPSEPETWADHPGPFASHYDEGRITRANDSRAYYVEAAMASIARYAEIEAQSGISFFTEAGALLAGAAGYMGEVAANRTRFAVASDLLDAPALARRFPFFALPSDWTGLHEASGAGHISPRRLVAAQTEAARRAGARVIDAEVIHVAPGRLRTGHTDFEAEEIIVAAGGWTDALLGRAPTLLVRPRTVALAEIGQAEAARLAAMPSAVLDTENGAYILPPIRYPDGKLWLKIGGDWQDDRLTTQSEINAWFRAGGAAAVRDRLADQLRQFLPGLAWESLRMAPCVTSWTATGTPEIARLSAGLTLATGGNGASAKCSDELGRRATAIATGLAATEAEAS